MATLPKHLEEAFNNLSKLKPEDFNSMIEETIKTIKLLQTKVDSKDPKDAKIAMDSILDLKVSLEEQIAVLMEGIGVNAQELKEFMLNPDNYSEEEKETMKLVDNKLVELHLPEPSKEPKKTRRSKKAAWIAG